MLFIFWTSFLNSAPISNHGHLLHFLQIPGFPIHKDTVPYEEEGHNAHNFLAEESYFKENDTV